MKILIKTKLLIDGAKKYVEVRDYELGKDVKVIHCVSKDYKACYHVGEEYMILPVNKQSGGKVVNTQQSMFPPYKYYKMIKFLWKPKGEVETAQISDKKPIFIGNKAVLP